ncbi:MAG: MarR family transcriptional regulator [Clostridia bacterium]|nr:MarR family transcriptional regulator [Clostridia bacterium]
MDSERFPPFVLFTERISKNIKRIADIKMAQFGLRSSHLMCILQLSKTEGGLSSTALAEACGVDKAFISRITSELVEKKYIVKDTSSSKGTYKNKYVLTEDGVRVKATLDNILEDCFSIVDTNISTRKLEIFYEILEKIDTGIIDLLKNTDKEQ